MDRVQRVIPCRHSMARQRRSRSFHLAAVIAVITACIACYANTFDNAFVVGDIQLIQGNAAIKDSSVLVTAFTRGYWWVGTTEESGTYYRPLVVLLDAWDHLLWGRKPFGYHLTNTLLHIGVTYLVFRLAQAWIRSPFAALGAALLFAVHPIHVHAVSYISARSALLCAALYAGAALAALRYRRDALAGRAGPRDLGIMLACYAGGLLALEAAITLPVALAVLLFPPREQRRAWLLRLVPFFASLLVVTAVYFIVRRLAIGAVLSHKTSLADHLPLVPVALTIAKTDLYYLAKLVVPTDLSYVAPFVPVLRAGDPEGLAGLFGLLAIVAVTLAGPRRWLAERAALGWVLLTLLPVSGLVPLDHFVKGQHAYLPSIGACILFASLGRRALRGLARRAPGRTALLAVGGASGLVLAGYGVQTLIENNYWQSPTSLYTRVIALEPGIPDELFPQPVMTPTANRFATIHLLVAAPLVEAQECDQAEPHYQRALWLTRRRALKREARLLEARCMFLRERYEDALAAYLPLVEEAPEDATAPMSVGAILLKNGNVSQALHYLTIACDRGSAVSCTQRSRVAGEKPR